MITSAGYRGNLERSTAVTCRSNRKTGQERGSLIMETSQPRYRVIGPGIGDQLYPLILYCGINILSIVKSSCLWTTKTASQFNLCVNDTNSKYSPQ